jgi:hypothetical protein
MSNPSANTARRRRCGSTVGPVSARKFSSQRRARMKDPGISNRESAREEAEERKEHPPVDSNSPPPEDAAGRVGERPLENRENRHTSHKAGSRSIAQKEAESKYSDHSMPASRKVPGAFGREPE